MTFWEQFYNLCISHGSKPNPVAKELGFSSSTVTQWKNGSVPSSKSVSKIAEYFNVSTDYLLGTETSEEPLDETDQQILMLARKSRVLSPEDKEKFMNVLKGSVDAFLDKEKK